MTVVVSPCTRTTSGLTSSSSPADGGEREGCEVAEPGALLHELEVDVDLKVERRKGLVEELPVLPGGHDHLPESLRPVCERPDHRGQLDRLRARPDDRHHGERHDQARTLRSKVKP